MHKKVSESVSEGVSERVSEWGMNERIHEWINEQTTGKWMRGTWYVDSSHGIPSVKNLLGWKCRWNPSPDIKKDVEIHPPQINQKWQLLYNYFVENEWIPCCWYETPACRSGPKCRCNMLSWVGASKVQTAAKQHTNWSTARRHLKNWFQPFFHKSIKDPSGRPIQFLDEKNIVRKVYQNISGYCIRKTIVDSFLWKEPKESTMSLLGSSPFWGPRILRLNSSNRVPSRHS